ncbi:MAG: MFS transporter [Bacteriovorax sp.]|nr:MFS transporter [Bacteriovorax sp.]
MQLFLVSLALTYIIVLYFMSNPLKHSKKFVWRRFINWFPLGMTYAFMYMGRYNLNVAKTSLGDLMTKEDFGFIGGVGFTVYALALFFIGPIVDRIGGKRGILIGAIGSAIMNAVMGLILYLFLNHRLDVNLVTAFSITYGLNMLFQSFGAVSTIKVKSFWFHVRERGTFGAIFGTLISLGVYFAFDWGEAIANAVKLNRGTEPSVVYNFLNSIIVLDGRTVPALWLIFYIPAIILVFWALIDVILLKDSPDAAGFDVLDTHDASHGEHEKRFSYKELMLKIFSNKIIWTIGIIEFTSGILRNGVLQWYKVFAKETGLGVLHITSNWGFWGCVTGIIGGFSAGWMSDHLFNSRRAPAAGIMQVIMFLAIGTMAIFLTSSPLMVGIAAVCVMMAVIGVHSIMSGTATADFGGKKASATATGVADAFAYAGSAVQSFALGILTTKSWTYWPLFLLPFTLIGLYFAIKMWRDIPEATKNYLASTAKKKVKSHS